MQLNLRTIVIAAAALAILFAVWPPFYFGKPITKEYPPDPPFRDPPLPGVTVQRVEVVQAAEPRWPFFAALGAEIFVGLLWLALSRQ
jgi:hypothetical protein